MPTTSTPPSFSTPHVHRLVRFGDGRIGVRGGLGVEVREPAPATGPVLDFIASTERLDRYDEVILAGGWRLDAYRRNPVFQNAHQYGDVIFTLGKALLTEVRAIGQAVPGLCLFQRIEFAVEVNPMARIAYGLYKNKFLNAVSVGFIPLRWETPADPAKAGYRRKYLEQELLEVSAVAVPANPDALQLGLKAGAIERADLLELLNLLRGCGVPGPDRPAPANSFCSNTAAPLTHASASGGRGNEAHLLQLARALRAILGRT